MRCHKHPDEHKEKLLHCVEVPVQASDQKVQCIPFAFRHSLDTLDLVKIFGTILFCARQQLGWDFLMFIAKQLQEVSS